MAEEDYKLCMCPNLGDKSNNLSVVAQLSKVTSGRTGPLPLLIIIQKMQTFKTISICLSQNDLLILPYSYVK